MSVEWVHLHDELTPKNVTLRPLARISYGRISMGYANTRPCLNTLIISIVQDFIRYNTHTHHPQLNAV